MLLSVFVLGVLPGTVFAGDSDADAAQNANTGVSYATLQAAIDAAGAGQTIKLLADVEEQITINKSMTLDLQGKNLRERA